jgi:hypothetical protein
MATSIMPVYDARPSIFMSTPTIFYDVANLSAVAELESHWITAWEYCARDARYSMVLPGGSTLDPTRSGVVNRRYIM